MNLPTFQSKLEVLDYLHAHKARLSPAELERLARLHDRLPCPEAAALIARRRRAAEEQLTAAWRLACAATDNPDERQRRMASAVAAMLGGDDIWKARRLAVLYLEHGMRRTNRAFIQVSSRPGFAKAPVDDRFRAVERAVKSKAAAREVCREVNGMGHD